MKKNFNYWLTLVMLSNVGLAIAGVENLGIRMQFFNNTDKTVYYQPVEAERLSVDNKWRSIAANAQGGEGAIFNAFFKGNTQSGSVKLNFSDTKGGATQGYVKISVSSEDIYRITWDNFTSSKSFTVDPDAQCVKDDAGRDICNIRINPKK